MIISTSSNAYSKMQSTSGLTETTVSPQPAQTSSVTDEASPSSGQTSISGEGLMMSRLFGNTNATPTVQTQLTKDTMGMDSVNFLTTEDRSMLSKLYAQAQEQGTDLRYVDDLAKDLGDYRMFSGTMANVNNGNSYDNTGHLQTIKFTDADTATATRILNSGNVSSSSLDSGFVNYLLDPGYSFAHRTNFEFLESVVNNSAQTVENTVSKSGSKFSSYASQGQNNFVVETASEVTLQTEEPDWMNIDGKFYVTETGLKNGYQLQDGKVVKNSSTAALENNTDTPKTLLDYMSSQNETKKEKTDVPFSLFDYFSSSVSDKKISE